jgi:hypothetical protein
MKKNLLPYSIVDGLVIDRESGAFRFSVETEGLRRYTAYVRYTYGAEGEYSIEEIDVDARNEGDARDVARRALESQYEDGGVIVACEERFGWYL